MATTLAANKKNLKRPRARSRAVLKQLLRTAFRAKFPQDTVDISDGFEGNIHVLVVSNVFDKMGERTRYSFLWRIVERTELTPDEKDLITVLLAYSPRELR